MAFHKSLSIFIFMAIFICYSHAYTFQVGGNNGWTLHPSENYTQWSSRLRFLINDTLHFKYDSRSDSVLVVNRGDYDNCNTNSPITKLQGGDSSFKFDRSGPFYFITGNKSNCDQGQKLTVVVLALRNRSPPPAAATPPSPAVSPVFPPSSTPSPASISPISPSPASISPISPSPASISPISPSPASISPISPSPASISPVSPSPASESPVSPSPAPGTPSLGPPAPSPGGGRASPPRGGGGSAPPPGGGGGGASPPGGGGGQSPGSGNPADVNTPPPPRSFAGPPLSGTSALSFLMIIFALGRVN